MKTVPLLTLIPTPTPIVSGLSNSLENKVYLTLSDFSGRASSNQVSITSLANWKYTVYQTLGLTFLFSSTLTIYFFPLIISLNVTLSFWITNSW